MACKVFPIARGSSAPLWFCGVIGLLTLGLGGFLVTLAFFGSRIATLEVSIEGLRVHGDVYGRFIARRSLQVTSARVLDQRTEPSYAPTERTNGTGLPNYHSGWFRLASGASALLFITDWNRAVLVPTTENFDLLVSPADPPAFLAALVQPPPTPTVFPLAPASSPFGSSLLSLLLTAALFIPLLIAALMGYLAYSTRAARFEVSGEGVRIRGDIFGRLIPRGALRVSDARILDLKKDSAHRPCMRTLGVGLPGYSSGWFRLNDSSKGLLFLTNRSRAIYLPTTDGYTLLISPADPDGFLTALAK
jgi:hypothetical protein